MKSKLIPKCQNNSGNAFGNLGDNIDYQHVLNNLHTISKDSEEEYTLKESVPWLYQALSEHAKANHQWNRDFLKESIENLLKGKYYFKDFPDVEVVKNAPIRVQTYYPGSSRYPFTGHSQLKRDTGNIKMINKTMDDPDYNLVTNNCANNSLDALNYTFGTQESPYFFVTPGDVRDFAKTLKGARFASDNSGDIIIPVSAKQARKYDEYVHWNYRRKHEQKKLLKKIQKEEDYKKAEALKQEFEKYTKGNPQKSPINEENKLLAQ